jgi:hypothetical protein
MILNKLNKKDSQKNKEFIIFVSKLKRTVYSLQKILVMYINFSWIRIYNYRKIAHYFHNNRKYPDQIIYNIYLPSVPVCTFFFPDYWYPWLWGLVGIISGYKKIQDLPKKNVIFFRLSFLWWIWWCVVNFFLMEIYKFISQFLNTLNQCTTHMTINGITIKYYY